MINTINQYNTLVNIVINYLTKEKKLRVDEIISIQLTEDNTTLKINYTNVSFGYIYYEYEEILINDLNNNHNETDIEDN